MRVPLLDLTLQYATIRDEIQPVLDDIITRQQFILGPTVAAFEQQIAAYCGSTDAVGVTSGSDALLLALMCADIGPGDTVITSPYTFFATAGSICRTGATPLFVDIEPDTYNIDPAAVAELLDSLDAEARARVKAIMPVHLYGQCADMAPLLDLARQHDLIVIEDAAQALGARYRMPDGRDLMACAMGDFGCLSFFPSKNLGCFGDGGMITTATAAAAQKLRSLRMHGQTAGQYYHEYIGMNGRLDALQAGVLSVKLPHLDDWAAGRRRNAETYARLFADAGLSERITLPAARPACHHVYNQFIIRAAHRDELKQHLAAHDIGCAIYYPLPLHLQQCFAHLDYRAGAFPHAERAARETLALPVFPELEPDQLAFVVETISSFYNQAGVEG